MEWKLVGSEKLANLESTIRSSNNLIRILRNSKVVHLLNVYGLSVDLTFFIFFIKIIWFTLTTFTLIRNKDTKSDYKKESQPKLKNKILLNDKKSSKKFNFLTHITNINEKPICKKNTLTKWISCESCPALQCNI